MTRSMALLDRLRSRRGASPVARGLLDAVPSPPAGGAVARVGAEVITPSILWGVPEWRKVPLMQPLLPEMPVVVSTRFEDSLAARRPPKLFLGALGHSVSELAPAGVVEAVAVLSSPAPGAAGDQPGGRTPSDGLQALQLVRPATPTKRDADRQPRAISRRVRVGHGDGSEPAPEAGGARPGEPAPEAGGARPGEAAPASGSTHSAAGGDDATPSSLSEADLHGSGEPGPAMEPTVRAVRARESQLESPTGGSPTGALTHAPTPPDMPLAQLRPRPLPAGETSESEGYRRAETPGGEVTPVESLAPRTAGLLGSSSPAEPVDPLDVVARQAVAPPAGAVEATEPPDLALALPAPEGSPSEVVARLPVKPPLEVRGQGELQTAPEPPTTGEPALPMPARPPLAARRFGLGEPMTSIPSTATSWDITTLTRAEQLQVSRALVQGHTPTVPFARATTPAALTKTVSRAEPAPARRDDGEELLLAGTPLRRAALERLESTSLGVPPPGLEPATAVEAPVLSSDPLLEVVTTAQPSEGAHSHGELGVRKAVGARYGVDLGGVPIDRSPQGSAKADRLGARAFTSSHGVVIPARVGSLSSSEGAGLLAHELTHVAQRMRLGASLPPEGSPAGQALEAEARLAEMTVAAPSARPAAEQHLYLPAAPAERAGAFHLPLASPPATDHDALAEEVLERLTSLATPGIEVSIPATTSWTSTVAPCAAEASVQRAPVTPSLPSPSSLDSAPSQASPGPPAHHPAASPFNSRPSDEELHNLSGWLYPMISHRIKGELREGRERAGLLTDTYRRW